MQTTTTTRRAGQGRHTRLATALDSPQTLALTFGTSTPTPDATAFAGLSAAFAQAVVPGCPLPARSSAARSTTAA